MNTQSHRKRPAPSQADESSSRGDGIAAQADADALGVCEADIKIRDDGHVLDGRRPTKTRRFDTHKGLTIQDLPPEIITMILSPIADASTFVACQVAARVFWAYSAVDFAVAYVSLRALIASRAPVDVARAVFERRGDMPLWSMLPLAAAADSIDTVEWVSGLLCARGATRGNERDGDDDDGHFEYAFYYGRRRRDKEKPDIAQEEDEDGAEQETEEGVDDEEDDDGKGDGYTLGINDDYPHRTFTYPRCPKDKECETAHAHSHTASEDDGGEDTESEQSHGDDDNNDHEDDEYDESEQSHGDDDDERDDDDTEGDGNPTSLWPILTGAHGDDAKGNKPADPWGGHCRAHITNAACAAARRGNVDIVAHLHETFRKRGPTCGCASRIGHAAFDAGLVGVLEWLDAADCSARCRSGSRVGRRQGRIPDRRSLLDLAIDKNDPALVAWAVRKAAPWHNGISSALVNTLAVEDNVAMMDLAVRFDLCRVSPVHVVAAAGAGSLGIVKWAAGEAVDGVVEARDGPRVVGWCTTDAVMCAAKKGRLDIVRWFANHPHASHFVDASVARCALSKRRYDVVRLLHEMGRADFGRWDALCMAVSSCDLATVSFVAENGGVYGPRVLSNAVCRGDLAILAYLCARYGFADAMRAIMAGAAVDVPSEPHRPCDAIAWLIKHAPDVCVDCVRATLTAHGVDQRLQAGRLGPAPSHRSRCASLPPT